MANPTPTPPGTPTQVYVRFRGIDNGQINAEIGCDGEENTTPEIRRVMSGIAMTISAFFATFRQADAAESSATLASYLASNEVPRNKENEE